MRMGGVSLLRSEHEIKVGGYLRCGRTTSRLSKWSR